MAMAVALAVFVLAAGVGTSEGAVHKVGDASGWTILGSPNYSDWASKNTFKMGDTIVFEYNKNIHNVLEVSKVDYDACNAASPIATHTSGNDSITIKSKGHLYFICGFPGHCLAGQKVDIDVSKSSSAAPSTAPVPSPSPVASPPSGSSPVASPPSGRSPVASPPSGSSPVASPPSGISPVASPPSSSSLIASPPVSPSANPSTAPTHLAPASSSGGSSISSSGGVSPSASAPKANRGTRAVSDGVAGLVALFSVAALFPF